jgi:hypothetical protein
MSTVAWQIPASVKGPEIPDIADQFTRLQALKNMQQQGQIQGQAIQENDIKLQQMKQDMADMETARKILGESGGDLQSAQPKLIQALGQKAIPIVENITKQQQAFAILNETQRKTAAERLKTFSDTIDEISSLPPEQRGQAYQAKVGSMIQAGIIPKEQASTLPQSWDDELMAMSGNHLKQMQNDLELQTKQQALQKAKTDTIISAQTAAGTTPMTQYQQAQLKQQAGNVTEPELYLKAAKGDKEAETALHNMVNDRIREASAKAATAGGGMDISSSTPDVNSTSILAQTGLSRPAYDYLTVGSTALSRMSGPMRIKYMKEGRDFTTKRGIDEATFRAQFGAINKTVEANVLRNNQSKVAQDELVATLDNLKSAADESSFKSLKWGNIAKMFAGEQVNDAAVNRYKFHLEQLRNEFAMYNAALQGQIDANGNIREINESDLKRAESIIRDGFAAGSLSGFGSALKASMDKMDTVLQRSVNNQNKRVWDLFGIGGNYKGQAPTGQSQIVTPVGKIAVISPEGTPGFIDASKWDAAQKRGFKKR